MLRISIALFFFLAGVTALNWLWLRRRHRQRIKAFQQRNDELRGAIETLNRQLRDHDEVLGAYLNLCTEHHHLRHEHYQLAIRCAELNAENSRLKILAGLPDGADAQLAPSKKRSGQLN